MFKVKPTVTLTQEQIDFFHREGYLAIDAVTTQEEIARLRVIYDRLFEARAGREVGDHLDLAGTDEEGIVGPSCFINRGLLPSRVRGFHWGCFTRVSIRRPD
jgi:hypothetical protein